MKILGYDAYFSTSKFWITFGMKMCQLFSGHDPPPSQVDVCIKLSLIITVIYVK